LNAGDSDKVAAPYTNPETPLVSVITVTLNCADALRKTIDSVAEQTYRNVEHIVVDGKSTDGTTDVIRGNQYKIARWLSEPDRGVYDAMNKGLSLTSGNSKFVNFLNAGDTYGDRSTLAEVVGSSRVLLGQVYGNYQRGSQTVIAPDKLNAYTLATQMPCHQAIFFDTDLHRRFLYDITFDISADYKLLLSMVTAGVEFCKLDKTLAIYDQSGLSATNRSRLREENSRIRREFPVVWLIHQTKRGLKSISSILAKRP
jgi:glycosyltransferase involved in cell wall biosynthesis